MGRIKKKGESGAAKSYITRTQAIRKLQISLPDFRRLCIFKGIYPREPRSRKRVSKSSTPSTTFYYAKDIQYLLHEPLLQKFREHKALAKKIGRALGRGEIGDAARLEKTQRPRMRLDHIIKERYPTFVDALRDLDDCLSMLFLFANLPSQNHIPPKTIALCQRLCHEFEHYIITSHSLRKSFLSIKGIYYQATIQGQDIMWLVPYRFVQNTAGDIDFRIMSTFIEFYTTLLSFVNFRLYTSIGLVYPPSFDASRADNGAELNAFRIENQEPSEPPKEIENGTVNGDTEASSLATKRAQAAADAILSNAKTDEDGSQTPQRSENNDDNEDANAVEIDTFEPLPSATDADILVQPTHSANIAETLFGNFTFFLNRETPRQPLEFILRAFGCKRIGWDSTLGDGAYTTDEGDKRITHQIVDRPPLQSNGHVNGAIENGVNGHSTEQDHAPNKVRFPHSRMPGRAYIQPQWVWDSINAGKLLRLDLYAPGATLPPHLSPWMKPRRGEYDPTQPLDPHDDDDEALAEREEAERQPIEGIDSVKRIADLNGTADSDASAGEDDAEDEPDEEQTSDDDDASDASSTSSPRVTRITPSTPSKDLEDDWGGFSSDGSTHSSGEDQRNAERQLELEAEAAGRPLPDTPRTLSREEMKRRKEQERRRAALKDKDELERQKMMMPRRKRKLLEKMLYSNSKKNEEAERLKAKRRRIERERETNRA